MTRIPQALNAFMALSDVPLTLARREADGHPLVALNDAFSALSGYDRAALLGRDCRLMQGPASQPGARAAIRRALDAGREVQVVITNYRRDGAPFDAFLFLFPIHDRDGRPAFYAGSQCALPADGRIDALARHGRALQHAIGRLPPAGMGGLRVAADELAALEPATLPLIRLRNLEGRSAGH